ncbi:MAG: hypothetical protein Q8R82_05445 [Hyphomonadaceae bacterium]|nr:hypothetical protein [Hyphomonadaceae bacterium]
MKVSLCLVKQAASSDHLVFESERLRWNIFDKGTQRKSGTVQPYNFLSAELVGEDDAVLSRKILTLFSAFSVVGTVATFLEQAQASDAWVRVEIPSTSDESRDCNLGPDEVKLLAKLNLGLEFWFVD